jgi:hypothetical protein
VSTTCQGTHCSSPAEVVVEPGHSPALNLCWGHLRQVLHEHGTLVAAFHRLGWHPRCSRDDCSRMAESTILDTHDLTRPLCRRHLADLGWIQLPGVQHTAPLGRHHG